MPPKFHAYRGRFAPSPTGPLHAGSLVAALASWLDARAHGGQWLVRIEDVDRPRTVPGATQHILQQLADCTMIPDETPVCQSDRTALYHAALERLIARDLTYPCRCSRNDIQAALKRAGLQRPRHGELVYPGTCAGTVEPQDRRNMRPAAWRLRTQNREPDSGTALVESAPSAINAIADGAICWTDRRLGPQQQAVHQAVGDFVLQRADGCFTYQLAVVVDDGAQGITHVVRGEDLADNTARQIVLQQALRVCTPVYLHTPLVQGANGEKLSKQNGARAVDTATPAAARAALSQAAEILGLPPAPHGSLAEALASWVAAYNPSLPEPLWPASTPHT